MTKKKFKGTWTVKDLLMFLKELDAENKGNHEIHITMPHDTPCTDDLIIEGSLEDASTETINKGLCRTCGHGGGKTEVVFLRVKQTHED